MRACLTPRARELGIEFKAPLLGDAGYDLCVTESAIISPGQTQMLGTGVIVEIPYGHVGLLKERSSIGKLGITLPGGVIDSGYRGEVMVLVSNTGTVMQKVMMKQRVGQMLVLPAYTRAVTLVDDPSHLSPTLRGDKGFGSTGK